MSVVQLHDNQAMPVSKTSPQIWAVASGKGGVGKSFVAANLSMALASHKKKVVLVDLDLGSANAHTCLGIHNPKTTLSHLLTQNNTDVNDLVVYADNPLVGLISGATDDLHMANLKHFQKLKIMRNLANLDADYVVLDLGAGTSFNTLDFFQFADESLLVVMPEPTSIENSYRFIRCLLSRILKGLPKRTTQAINAVLTQQKKATGKTQSFASFLHDIHEKKPKHGKIIAKALENLNINLLVNQVIDPSDTKLVASMEVVFRKYFDIQLYPLGYLYHDIHVIQSLKQQQPYHQLFPQSRNTTRLQRMAANIILRKTPSSTGSSV